MNLVRNIVRDFIRPTKVAAKKAGLPIVYLTNHLDPSTTENNELRNMALRTYGVDILNVWGQILIGLSLIIGLLSTTAALFGALMMFTYYFAIPPFIESYIFIDKNLLELFALLILALFPTSRIVGIDLIVKKYRSGNNG